MTNQRFSLILPAAGSGRRLGTKVAKPYVQIHGKTILEHTIRPFLDLEELGEIVLVTSAAYRRKAESILHSLDVSVPCQVIEGGAERQDSIQLALDAADGDMPLVLVHDAVRPFVKPEQIRACLQKAAEKGAAILAVPTRDTIKQASPDLTVRTTPNRRAMWQAQTPQVFQGALIREAYRKAAMDRYVGTDDASLVERIGSDVHLVQGGYHNLKITFPADLNYAEWYLSKTNNDTANGGEG